MPTPPHGKETPQGSPSGSGGNLPTPWGWVAKPNPPTPARFQAQYLQKPKPRELKRYYVTIPDTLLILGSEAALIALVEQALIAVDKELVGTVNVTAYQDPASRTTRLVVAEVPPAHGFDVKDQVRLVAAIAGALKVDPVTLKPVRVPGIPKPMISSNASQASTGVFTLADLRAAWANLMQQTATPNSPRIISNDQPEPPPAPEPFWSPTPLYGFRSWRVAGKREWVDAAIREGTLMGNVANWRDAKIHATCRITTLSLGAKAQGHAPYEHTAPHWGCHCGIYICNSPEHPSVRGINRLIPDYYTLKIPIQGYAIGLVELTGTIIEHEFGARGENGEIKHLWVGPRVADNVRRIYPEVPITVVGDEPTDWDEPGANEEHRLRRLELRLDMLDKKKRLEEPWLK